MNLGSPRFRQLLSFFILALVLVGGELWASDQVQSSCVTNNCDSAPLSCTNEMVLTAGQLECEQLRSEDSEEFLGPGGYCACLSALGAKTRGAGYMYLSEKRVKDIEKLVLDTISKDFAREYIEASRDFSELYFSAKTSGFYDENELEAFMVGLTLEELNQLPSEQRALKIAKAKEHIASCSGTRLYDEMQAQREGEFCKEAGPELVNEVIRLETTDSDGQQAYDNFSRSLSKAGVPSAEIKIRYIEFKAIETLDNNLSAASVIGETYSGMLNNFQSGRPVSRENLLNLELITAQAARSPGKEAQQVMGQIMENLVILARSDNASEYEAKSLEIEKLVRLFPTYAKVIRWWGGERNKSIERGIAKFLSDNRRVTADLTSKALYDYFERKIELSQRDLFRHNLIKCKQREDKRKMLCEAARPSGHGVHINDLKKLNPANVSRYAQKIIEDNRIPEDEQPLLRQHLDILACASNGPKAALCRPGTSARARYNGGAQDPWAHLDFTTMLFNERRECTAGISTSLFYPGWRESNKEDVLARNGDSERSDGILGGIAVIGDENESLVALADSSAGKAFVSSKAAERGLENNAGDSESSSGLFGSIAKPVKTGLSKRYADHDRAVLARKGSSPGVLATTSSNMGIGGPNSFLDTTSTSPLSENSINNEGRAPASVSARIDEMVSSTLSNNRYSATSPAVKVDGATSEADDIVSELIDEEGNFTENYSDLSTQMSEREKNLVSEVAKLKAELAKMKTEAKEKEQLGELTAELKREKELKAELEKKSNELASTFKAREANRAKNVTASTRVDRPSFSAPRVLGPATNTPVQANSLNTTGSYQSTTYRSAPLASTSGLTQAAAGGVNLNRSSLSSGSGLTLISSGEGVFRVEGAGDPSALSAENYARIKSALEGSRSQVVVEFPDGRRFVYTENPETDELIQTPEAIFSLADLKRLDEGLKHMDDPEARTPASVVDVPELENAPTHKWSDVLNILRESGASSGQ